VFPQYRSELIASAGKRASKITANNPRFFWGFEKSKINKPATFFCPRDCLPYSQVLFYDSGCGAEKPKIPCTFALSKNCHNSMISEDQPENMSNTKDSS
jgi:hypothetical protein